MAQSQDSNQEVALAEPRLPYFPELETDYGVKPAEWRALCEAVFPSAKTTGAICLALSYCKSRGLDPFKRVVHIVPIWDSVKRATVETVWPGIGELRTTAHRTALYAGMDEATWGEEKTKTFKGKVKEYPKGGGTGEWKDREETATFPEWCQITVYRMVQGERVAFPGPRVFWLETYGQRAPSILPNTMWLNRSWGQLEKCAEAAALRRAFPEELGNEYVADEVEHGSFEAASRARDMGNVEEVPEKRPDRKDYGPEAAQESPADSEPNEKRESQEKREPSDSQETDAKREPDDLLETVEPRAQEEWWTFATMLTQRLDVCQDEGSINSVLREFSDDLAVLEKENSIVYAAAREAAGVARERVAEGPNSGE